jgi:hypothetical protein
LRHGLLLSHERLAASRSPLPNMVVCMADVAVARLAAILRGRGMHAGKFAVAARVERCTGVKWHAVANVKVVCGTLVKASLTVDVAMTAR